MKRKREGEEDEEEKRIPDRKKMCIPQLLCWLSCYFSAVWLRQRVTLHLSEFRQCLLSSGSEIPLSLESVEEGMKIMEDNLHHSEDKIYEKNQLYGYLKRSFYLNPQKKFVKSFFIKITKSAIKDTIWRDLEG